MVVIAQQVLSVAEAWRTSALIQKLTHDYVKLQLMPSQ